MENNRKQAIEQYLCTLKDRYLEIGAIKRDITADLNLLPGTDDYDDLRDYYTDAIDNLDSVTTDLFYLIKRIDLEINGPSEVEVEPMPADTYNDIPLPQEEKPGFFSKLMLGLFGAHAARKAEEHLEQQHQEREQRRHDDLYWQDAVRRGSSDDDIDSDEDWDSL